MKYRLPLYNFIAIATILLLTACSSALGDLIAEPTATFTATNTAVPATATPLPPTDTPTPLPTETPTPLPPTATIALPTPIPVTPTNTRVPTQEVIEPWPSAKYEGTFEGGTLTLRTNDRGTYIIPKVVAVRKATCSDGKKISDTITFEPPPFYLIEDGKFWIGYGDLVQIGGQFISATQATGTIELSIKSGGRVCKIGPIVWRASMSE
jgi:hypothetical protein